MASLLLPFRHDRGGAFGYAINDAALELPQRH